MDLGRKLNYNLYLNYVAIGYAFFLPLSRAGIGVFSFLLIALWLLEGNFKQKFLLYKHANIAIMLSLFLLLHVVSLLWTEHLFEAIDGMKKFWYVLPMFILMVSIKKQYIGKILSAFILGMFVSEFIAYGVFFEFWHFKHATVANPSPFMHHIEYSVFLALTALILLSRIFNEGNIKYKLFYSFFFVTVTGNLFLTAGRTGQLAFILGLFVLAMSSFKNKLKGLLVSLLLPAFIIGLAFNLSDTFHDRIITGKNSLISVIEKENYCTSWGSRVGAWILSKDMIISDPILGVGTADNMHEFHTLIDSKYPQMKCMHESFMHVHNQYLQVWTSLGILGLIVFLSIFYFIYRLPIKNSELNHLKYVYLSILLFAFIPEVLWGRQFSLALFALMIGLILAQNRIENETVISVKKK